MSSSPTCRRCHVALTPGHSQAIAPDLCTPCWCGPLPAPARREPAPRRKLLPIAAMTASLCAAACLGSIFVVKPCWPRPEAAPTRQAEPEWSEGAELAQVPLRPEPRQAPPPPVEAPPELPTTPQPDPVPPPVREPVVPVLEQFGPPREEVKPLARRNQLSEEELLKTLLGAEEVGLVPGSGSIFTAYVTHVRSKGRSASHKGPADCDPLLSLRPDFVTLPLKDGQASILPHQAASELGVLSRKLRAYLNQNAPPGDQGQPRDMTALRLRLRQDLRGKKPEWLRAEAVPTLNQMLMGEDAPTRRLLVELLDGIKEKPATLALVQRAVFDLDAGVRAAAVESLRGRDPEVWRPALFKGLTYPWPPPAAFAAEALAGLKDAGVVPELVALLKEPPPGRPFLAPDRRLLIREVVKINHLRNCMLCHPPALRGDEPVLGIDPVWTTTGGSNGPVAATARRQITLATGAHDYSDSSGSPVLIRGDITFMRQDFAVSFHVVVERPPAAQQVVQNNPALARAAGLIPPPVRFDYVVRTRAVSKAEQKKWQALKGERNQQREAVVFALREITGKKLDDTTEAWVKAYPLAERQVLSVKLADRLLREEPLGQLALLNRYAAGDGVEHTWAIARAIPRLKGPNKEAARLALADRLAKQPVGELRQYLDDGDPEVRQAAQRAAGQKNDRVMGPNLNEPAATESSAMPVALKASRR